MVIITVAAGAEITHRLEKIKKHCTFLTFIHDKQMPKKRCYDLLLIPESLAACLLSRHNACPAIIYGNNPYPLFIEYSAQGYLKEFWNWQELAFRCVSLWLKALLRARPPLFTVAERNILCSLFQQKCATVERISTCDRSLSAAKLVKMIGKLNQKLLKIFPQYYKYYSENFLLIKEHGSIVKLNLNNDLFIFYQALSHMNRV